MDTELWRRNLYAMFIAEFAVMMGFSFVLPLLPLYIKEVGNFTNTEAALWTGIAVGSGGFAMFVSAPIWGIIADRWGRKSMVLRAQFAGAVLLALMGLAPNIHSIVVLRFLMGLTTGTVSAASALVASQTPRDKLPFAMGLLMVAVYGGTTLGPFFGGLMADHFGYNTTFFVTAAILFLGGLIVLIFVKEDFQRSRQSMVASIGGMWRLAASRKTFALLVVIGITFAGPQMISPIIPLSIKEMDPQAMAATMSGVALGLIGLLSVISSIIAGRLGGQISLKRILTFSCIITGLLYLPPIWAGTVPQMVILIGLTGLFIGALQTSSNTLIGLSVLGEQHGIAYGLVASAASFGMGLGSLTGGSLASLIGLRPVFGVVGGLFMVVGLLIIKLIADPGEAQS
jgi:DHA1 family multidrug resistance protein-like MFS transporter